MICSCRVTSFVGGSAGDLRGKYIRGPWSRDWRGECGVPLGNGRVTLRLAGCPGGESVGEGDRGVGLPQGRPMVQDPVATADSRRTHRRMESPALRLGDGGGELLHETGSSA